MRTHNIQSTSSKTANILLLYPPQQIPNERTNTTLLRRAFADPPLAHRRKRTLARNGRRDAQDRAVQENLPEAQVDPVPDEERLERAEGRDEREDAWREEVRDLGADVGKLQEQTDGSVSGTRAYIWGVFARRQNKDVPGRAGRPMGRRGGG